MDDAIRVTRERIDDLENRVDKEDPNMYPGRLMEALALLRKLELARGSMVVTRNEALKLDALSSGASLLDGNLVYWVKGENEWFSNTGSLVGSAVVIFDEAGIKSFSNKPTEEEITY